MTGATGRQGGATARALVRANEGGVKFTILAVTRNTEGAAAKKLAALLSAKRLSRRWTRVQVAVQELEVLPHVDRHACIRLR